MSWTDLQSLIAEADHTLGRIESGKLQLVHDEKLASIADVVDEFNGIRPFLKQTEIAGNGVKRRFLLDTTVIAGWDAGFSQVQSLHLVADVGTDSEDADEIDDEAFEYRLTADATPKEVLFFLFAAPATGQTLRIVWSLPHTVKDLDGAAATSIKARDKQAFLLLVASEFARKICCRACDLSDLSMGMDQVDYKTFSERWRINAKELRRRAIQRWAPSELSTGAAGSSTEWEPRDRQGNARVAR